MHISTSLNKFNNCFVIRWKYFQAHNIVSSRWSVLKTFTLLPTEFQILADVFVFFLVELFHTKYLISNEWYFLCIFCVYDYSDVTGYFIFAKLWNFPPSSCGTAGTAKLPLRCLAWIQSWIVSLLFSLKAHISIIGFQFLFQFIHCQEKMQPFSTL